MGKETCEAVKLKVSGWIEDDKEEYSNIPKKCPKCSRKLRQTDASKLCGIIMVYCPDYKCRYCEIYEV